MLDLISSPETRARSVVRSKAPATCGEFVQGCIDGQHFLVNCPVDLYAEAGVRPCGADGVRISHAGDFGKIIEAADVMRRTFHLELHHEIAIRSDIPRGKGMASSTADLTAALQALCISCDMQLSDRQFARVLTAVEPSDCVHFPGIAHVDHLGGRLFESLPAPAGMRVLVVDCGGEVDTVSFDRARAASIYRREEPAIRAALHLMKLGLRRGDKHAVATAATLSAQISQQILPKPQFNDLLACARHCGALGVNCAHSGTVLGVLYDEDEALGEMLADAVEDTFGAGVTIQGDYRIIGGGRHAC
ncbi:hypothetical protein [Piscinibacter koreensis]|uniref:GHMP kinase n=1 Tax=Piscinibacter koreensis TaxID=2742824 RepID=A0A7Y6NRA2_9BURK|nr:hypothetical protein [Schlegelella koreensis]NUZ07883.1 hypothetical protein [Schlegelella koreensis]